MNIGEFFTPAQKIPFPSFTDIMNDFQGIHDFCASAKVLSIRINPKDVKQLMNVVNGNEGHFKTMDGNYLYGAEIQGNKKVPKGMRRYVVETPMLDTGETYLLWFDSSLTLQ